MAYSMVPMLDAFDLVNSMVPMHDAFVLAYSMVPMFDAFDLAYLMVPMLDAYLMVAIPKACLMIQVLDYPCLKLSHHYYFGKVVELEIETAGNSTIEVVLGIDHSFIVVPGHSCIAVLDYSSANGAATNLHFVKAYLEVQDRHLIKTYLEVLE